MAVKSYTQRIRWFNQARFGLFIHYGLFALRGRGEWVMWNERIPRREYARLADEFRPARGVARQWAKLAVDAGARYAVFTTRHHDGYSLFRSKVDAYNSVDTGPGRDLVAEFVEACRTEGLRVGLYYSQLDFRSPGYWEPKRYPPERRRLIETVHAQVEELMTGYGKIDMLWYDGSWVGLGMHAVDKAKFWKAAELNAKVRQWQPDILINNRLGTREDLDTPEQKVAASEPGRAWESCMTLGDWPTWGWAPHQPNRKPLAGLLQSLSGAASGGGNFLLNIGPRPNGTVEPAERRSLRAIGDWLKLNGESIYGSEPVDLDRRGPFAQGFHHQGLFTRVRGTYYLHIHRWSGPVVTLPPLGRVVRRATLLGQPERPLSLRYLPNQRLEIGNLPLQPPHPCHSVIKLECRGPLRALPEPDLAAWLEDR